jgi:hypothetical protein
MRSEYVLERIMRDINAVVQARVDPGIYGPTPVCESGDESGWPKRDVQPRLCDELLRSNVWGREGRRSQPLSILSIPPPARNCSAYSVSRERDSDGNATERDTDPDDDLLLAVSTLVSVCQTGRTEAPAAQDCQQAFIP